MIYRSAACRRKTSPPRARWRDTAAYRCVEKRCPRSRFCLCIPKDGAETVTMQEKIQAYYEEIDQVRNHAFVQLDAVSSQWEAAGQIGPAPPSKRC